MRLADQAPAVAQAMRRPSAQDLAATVQYLVGLLDGVSTSLHRGDYPDPAAPAKTTVLLRAVADHLQT